MEQGISEGAGRGGHEDPGGGLIAHQDRKGSHMIEVRVADDNRVEAVMGDLLVARKGEGASFLGVHPSIDYDTGLPNLKQVAVSPDLVGPVQKSKSSISHGYRGIWP